MDKKVIPKSVGSMPQIDSNRNKSRLFLSSINYKI